MKLFLRLAVVLLSTAALAIPLDRFQTPMTEKHEHDLSDTYTHRVNFKTPFVVKAPPQQTPPSPAAKKQLRVADRPAPEKPSWLDRWTVATIKGDIGDADGSCFCAGGSVCCSTSRGMNCNYGVCGI